MSIIDPILYPLLLPTRAGSVAGFGNSQTPQTKISHVQILRRFVLAAQPLRYSLHSGAAGGARPAPVPVGPGDMNPQDELASLSPAERQKRVAQASGWRDEWPRQRAYQEAFSSLLIC